MDSRAAKLALARQKLKNHQEKKLTTFPKNEIIDTPETLTAQDNATQPNVKDTIKDYLNSEHIEDGSFYKYDQDISNNLTESDKSVNIPPSESGVNVTEILISNKRHLEMQLCDLQSKLSELEGKYDYVTNNYNIANETIRSLENQLKNIQAQFSNATNDLEAKDRTIENLIALKSSLSEENVNFQDQLDFTKTILTAKENENCSLQSQLFNLQNQLDATQLQLQQLTNGSFAYSSNNKNIETDHKVLLHKIASLEQQLKVLQKERDQINVHYEHYVSELNEQLKSVMSKNETLTLEIQQLSNRENGLIEQISDLEIRLQNYNTHKVAVDNHTSSNSVVLKELECKYEKVQESYNTLTIKYNDLQKQFQESNSKIIQLSHQKESEQQQDNISISKLTADITSDKIAAQRATEQNKKLKQDIQGLEDAFVKMSKDKLELTEKLTAEKYLTRELTIKLADVEEKAKEMQIKLKAKDEEMIRLQTSNRHLEKQFENLQEVKSEDLNSTKNIDENSNDDMSNKELNDKNVEKTCVETNHNHQCMQSLSESEKSENNSNIPKEDAMKKLQERFLKIMGDVADLSDEKHRLEHIILQLQNETETICEYVALYQQQRSLLKRRDEERSAQIKMFESECAKLKSQLEELTIILVRFSEDKELSSYFQIESRQNDIRKIMNLLTNLKHNSLIDTKKKDLDFKNFYPCNCCSGKLIEV